MKRIPNVLAFLACLGMAQLTEAAPARPVDDVYTISIPTDSTVMYTMAKWTFWLPPGTQTVRALLVHQHGCSYGAEDHGTTIVYDEHWRALARKHDAVLIGSTLKGKHGCGDWNNPDLGTGKAFLKAIDEFAAKSSHPEANAVPWVLWGHSGGGRWSRTMATQHPQKILALFLRSAATFGGKDTVANPAFKTIPVILNPGLREKGHARFDRIWHAAVGMHAAARGIDAYTTWAPDPKSSHDCRFSRFFAIPYIDECLAQRLPAKAGTNTMRPMDAKRAWLGNTESWEIAPAKNYKGDPKKATWLPSERVARVWQEYVKTSWVKDSTPPTAGPTDLAAAVITGATVRLTWKATADFESGIKTFRFYRDGKRLDDHVWDLDEKGNPVMEFQRPSYHDALEHPVPRMVYLDRNLAPGTYKYQISTLNFSDLESPLSEAVSVNVPPVEAQKTAFTPAPN